MELRFKPFDELTLLDKFLFDETMDERIVEASDSERIRKIHTRVNRVRKNEKAGVKYMQKWEELQEMRQEGLAAGRIKGRNEGRIEAITLSASIFRAVHSGITDNEQIAPV